MAYNILNTRLVVVVGVWQSLLLFISGRLIDLSTVPIQRIVG